MIPVPDASDDAPLRLAELGHLSAGVGHHVINAFSAIVSNAEIFRLLADVPDAADPAAVADIIVKTAVEASGVARRLIDFSRTATALGPEFVALDRLVADVVDSERASGRPGLEWITDLTPVPLIRGNTLQLHAMLGHLLTNAYEAMPPEGGTVRITTGIEPRGWVALEIQDNGQGLTEEARQRAVEPFFTTKPGRFGVGLSIANAIWRRHRGTLALRGRPGEGTIVRLCVEPAADAPSRADASPGGPPEE